MFLIGEHLCQILQLGGKKVENPETLQALKIVSESERFSTLQDGNNDLTETELGSILDIDHPEWNRIDEGDRVTHSSLEKTGLSEEHFVALAKEYHQRFPAGAKRVSSSLWAPAGHYPPVSDWTTTFLEGQLRFPNVTEKVHCSEEVAPLPKGGQSKGPSDIILISGPGGTAFDTKFVEQFKSNLSKQGGVANVTALGDGKQSVDIAALKSALQKAKKAGKPVTIVINTHGEIKQGSHHIETSEGQWTPTSKLFQIIQTEIGDDAPISLFMTACYGGAAIAEAKSQLPKGTSFVALAPSKETVAGSDVERLVEVLGEINADLDGNKWPEGIELLYLYLTRSLETRIAPQVGIGAGESIDLHREFKCHIGKTFSVAEKSQIHGRLDKIIGAGEVNNIITKIETAKTEWNISAADFGKSLAVMLALHDQ